MSGTAEPVRPPRSDAELARDLVRRTESLENPTSQRVGAWVFSTSNDGHLIASHMDGGSVIIARRPNTGENDPDAIVDSRAPSLSATRTALQGIAAGGSVVRFDGVEVEEGGDWTSGQQLFDAVQVPVSGAYRVSGCVHVASHASNTPIGVGIRVDGAFRAGLKVFDTTNTWMSASVSRILRLTAGQSVDLYAYATSAVNIGAADWWTPGVPPTTLDINLVTEAD
ncbi:hypothetical protein [Nocardia wallacei]|uniref:Uncharacterized protein n=1 Tax=Nocardia wallacei TaxID=480035 RepID=A0A7G1KT38_9NOCA|nr:hypothetical protein [Nocardia wallacei]BCK58418.1 hypothetical protein NWFMUON74_61900 [Nocardia wallacei]